jgi:hypothetical protein
MRRSLGLFGLVTALFTSGFEGYLRIQPGTDLDSHIAYAERIHSVADITSPHFLFELVIKAVHEIGADYIDASAIVLGLCYGGMAVLLARELERRGTKLGAPRLFLVVLTTLIASHVFVFTAFEPRPNWYYGYFVPTTYHNPTQQPNKLLGLWIYFLFCSTFVDARREPWRHADDSSQPPRRNGLLTGTLCVLSALTKPSFLIAFLPASGMDMLRDLLRRRWRAVALFAASVAIPSGVVMLWQARLAYVSGSPIGFAPFVVFDFWQTLYKLPLSLGFTLVVVAAAWRRRLLDDRLRFAWLYAAIALFVTLCVVEQGFRLMHGNFAWTGQTGVFLLYVESVLFLLTRSLDGAWRRVAWAVFAVHVACGIAWFGLQFVRHSSEWL